MIVVKNVSKSYIDSEKQLKKPILKRIFSTKEKKCVIKDLSFIIKSGEIVGYIGENGAGKSTTIKMLLGIIPFDGGQITVFNRIPFKNRQKNAEDIGVLFGQKSHLWWDLPLIDSFKFLQKVYGKTSQQDNEWLQWLMAELNTLDYVNQPVRELSLGQRMRGEFICAVLHKPKLVILDEPTIGLDVQTKQKLMEIILKINTLEQTTFLMTSHDFHEIEKVCHRVMLLEKGTIVYQGSIQDYKENYSYYKKCVVPHHYTLSLQHLKALTHNVDSTEFYFDTRVLLEKTLQQHIDDNAFENCHITTLSFSELMIIKNKEK